MTLLEFGKNQKSLGIVSNMNNTWHMLAQELGVCESMVKHWVYGTKRVAAKHVLPLEKLTNGEVGRCLMRPDLYPLSDYR